MFNEFNPYTVLGVAKDASEEDIKKAYRELAKNTHPDKNGGKDDAFKNINRAYQLLMDKDDRAYFDATGGTDRKVADIDRIVFQTIVDYFSRVVSELDETINPLTQDLISTGKAFFKQQVSNFEQQLAKYHKSLITIEKIEAKLKSKKGTPYINRGLKHQALTIRNHIQVTELQIKANKRAIEVIDEYTFDADPQQLQVFQMWSNTTGFTGI